MSRLLGLLQKGFMKLTKGRQIMWVAQDEMIITESDFKEFVIGFADKHAKPLKQRIQELEEMGDNSYRHGYEEGIKKSSNYTLLLPSAIREENKYLVDIVGLIASELLEQGDSESCAWLLKKIYQCRSL